MLNNINKFLNMLDYIEKLQKLGLSKRESEIYLALLKRNEFTAPEIGKITSVSRNKSYEILQSLVKKKLCSEKFKDGVKVFSCIKPEIALQNIISIHEEELNRKKKFVEQFKDELIELHTANEDHNSPLDYIEVLTNSAQIKERWLSIQRDTRKELLIFTKPPYTGTLDDNYDGESSIIKKNVTFKSIYEYKDIDTVDKKNEFISIVKGYTKLGEEARVVEELPMKLVISDDTISMFALKDRISLMPSITTMIVNHPSFALALRKVFESYWNSGLSLEQFEKEILFET